jgi:hypothetical protein
MAIRNCSVGGLQRFPEFHADREAHRAAQLDLASDLARETFHRITIGFFSTA